MKAENETKRNIKLAVDYGLYTLIACVFVLPIIYMFVSAFKTDAQIVSDMSTVKAFLPTGKLSFDNFVAIVDQVKFFRFFKNSALVTLLNVSLATILNAMAGYCLGMLDFKSKKTIISLIIALSIVPSEAVVLNKFMIVNKLGMINSLLGLAIPSVGYPMFIFLYYNHFKGMPKELVEAAIVDGETYGGVFWKIMLPLSKPVLATVTIMGFIRSWGDLLWPTLVTRDETWRTLPLALRALSTDVYIYWGQIFAFSSLMTLPVLILFLVFQKQFIASVTSSGIKG
jgi:multiple sugar transport system permease protein